MAPIPAFRRRRGPWSSSPRPSPSKSSPSKSSRPHAGPALASKARSIFCATLLLAASCFGAQAIDELATARIVIAPPMSRPDYLQAVTDPLLGTSFIRITDPGRALAADISCKPAYCRHRYSSTQAWNADQTLFAISDGCNGICFLDGRTYEPAFHRLTDDDCKWHPTDPAIMICMSRRRDLYLGAAEQCQHDHLRARRLFKPPVRSVQGKSIP